MYGLKKAPRQWYRKFKTFMVDHGFNKIQIDHCVCVKKYDRGDFLIVEQDLKKIRSLKRALNKYFALKDMGLAKKILGMHIVQDQTNKLLWLSHEKYVTKGV